MTVPQPRRNRGSHNYTCRQRYGDLLDRLHARHHTPQGFFHSLDYQAKLAGMPSRVRAASIVLDDMPTPHDQQNPCLIIQAAAIMRPLIDVVAEPGIKARFDLAVRP